MKSKCLMCCGCGRFMLSDGTVSDVSCFNGGIVDYGRMYAIQTIIFSADTDGEIEDFARAKGWTVRDAEGKANHRCPTCKPAGIKLGDRKGAIVDTRLLFGR